MRFISTLFLLFILVFNSIAQSKFSSVQSGDWDDASTWELGAGTGGTAGVDYPSPSDEVYIKSGDTVYLNFGTTGILYEFEGYMEVDSNAIFWVTVGDNNNGFSLEGEARVFNRGQIYTALANQGPGTVNPYEIDLFISERAIYYAYGGSYNYFSDDVNLSDEGIFYVEQDVCLDINDDFNLDGSQARLCGDGGASIGLNAASNTVNYSNGASAGNLCNGLTVYRGAASVCNPSSATVVVVGSGPTNLPPRAVDDEVIAAEATTANYQVTYIGLDDIDLDGSNLRVLQFGSNAAIDNKNSTEGGSLLLNDNGTTASYSDDYISYTPPNNYIGGDSFQYIIQDDDGENDTALVNVEISPCGSASIANFTSTYATFESEVNDVNNETNAEGAPDGAYAEIYNNNQTLTLDFGQVFPAGTQYEIIWRRKNFLTSGTSIIDLSESTNAASGFINHPAPPQNNDNVNFTTSVITANVPFRYLRFDKGNSSTTDYELDAVDVKTLLNCETDTDEDGIANSIDLDDDNDGIPDLNEASVCVGKLNYEFYEGSPTGNTVDNIPTAGALGTGTVSDFDVDALQAAVDPGDGNTFSVRWTGFINIDTDETYTFYSSSDDGSKVFIDGIEVVDNDGLHGVEEESGTIILTAGTYSFEALFFENSGGEFMSVSYSSPSISKTTIPFNVLSDVSNCDSDNDGIINSIDLDSDNDGISDLLEAGGQDANLDGKVDVFADDDGDGYANIFDSDNGGIALVDPDTDGDDLVDRVDIDSDGDGIVDNIEAQATSASILQPSGNDLNGNGVDDAFDLENGSGFLSPINSDGTDLADYRDTDSDNDFYTDQLEAFDLDNDKVADTNPSGQDDDLDGLDDAYDNIVGPNSSTNVSNNGETALDFPNDDKSSTAERDWREGLDSDEDGIVDFNDLDDDNDGILDVEENTYCASSSDNSLNYEFYDLLPSGNTVDNIPTSGALSAGKVTEINVDNLQNAVDPGDANQYSIRYTGFINIPITGNYTFYTTSDDGSKLLIDGNEVVDNDGNHSSRERSGSVNLNQGTYPITILFFEDGGDDILDVEYAGPSISKTALPFTILSSSSFCDSDGDGIANQIDLDSDNDGIPDIVEAGGVDSNNDGRADSNTDTDSDGYLDLYDTDNGGSELSDVDSDGDGLLDRLDLDSDADGISDLIEAGGADSNGDGILDDLNDADGDGFSALIDSDEGGSPLADLDSDGDGNLNRIDLDSDNDGITDNVEGQTTASFVAPSGSDTDLDGIDDSYDSDNGGTPIAANNQDGFGSADYISLDTDGDGLFDWSEGFDDNNSMDALDDLINRADIFETNAGNPLYYVNTDDADNDGVPDWLEDDDADNLLNFLDPSNAFYRDTDNDGLVDLYDTDNFGSASNLPDGDFDGLPDFRDPDNQISLPVSLDYFEAEKNGNKAVLSWSTLSEINNDYFLVKRSTDGEHFETIGKIDGNGNSTLSNSYSLIDANPQKGGNYYKLIQVDFNGDSKEEGIRFLEFDQFNIGTTKIYPNPNSGESLFIKSTVEYDNAVIRLINGNGVMLYSLNLNFDKESIVHIDLEHILPNLAEGLYVVSIVGEEKREDFKLLIR